MTVLPRRGNRSLKDAERAHDFESPLGQDGFLYSGGTADGATTFG
jgi:hypothetical protein